MSYVGVCTGVLSWGSAIRRPIPVGIGFCQPWSYWNLLEGDISTVLYNITYNLSYQLQQELCEYMQTVIYTCAYILLFLRSYRLLGGCWMPSWIHLGEYTYCSSRSNWLFKTHKFAMTINITTTLVIPHIAHFGRDGGHCPMNLVGGITRLLVYIALNIHFLNISHASSSFSPLYLPLQPTSPFESNSSIRKAASSLVSHVIPISSTKQEGIADRKSVV